jgi:hypothetical protein
VFYLLGSWAGSGPTAVASWSIELVFVVCEILAPIAPIVKISVRKILAFLHDTRRMGFLRIQKHGGQIPIQDAIRAGRPKPQPHKRIEYAR